MTQPSGDDAAGHPPAPADTTAAVASLSDREPVNDLARTADEDWRQDIALKRRYANFALIGLSLQVLVANAVFIAYGHALHWRLPTASISAWLGATVVQVVAVALAVTRGLFPGRR